jgi:hypothetical protein
MKLKIENPNRLVEMYKEIAPNWIMKFRGSSGNEYKFGLQSDNTKVWDEFQIYITKEMDVVWDTDNCTPHYYVKLKVVEQLNRKSLTNVIRLDECRNPQKLIEHILDGMDAIVQS